MFNIAIDGTTSSGKTTIAKILAKKLNMKVFDTGALYRAIACGYQRTGKSINEKSLKKFIASINMKVDFIKGEQHVYVNGIDETDNLRKEEISDLSSLISPYKFVRNFVLSMQRDFASKNECVMEGRDITSEVLPNADIKFFFDADVTVRAKRRYEQQKNKPFPQTFEKVFENLKLRDMRDKNREYGKLKIVDDAVFIDSTEKTIDEMLDFCYDVVKKEFEARKKCLVTGCTGHIGNVLIRNLLENRYKVTALVLPSEDLTPIKDLDVKLIEGDVTDRDFIFKIIKKDYIVFHLAGIIDIGSIPEQKVFKVNIDGTKNVVDACIKNKAKKLLYTSTVNIIDPIDGRVLKEPKTFNAKIIKGPYAVSKYQATQYILDKCKDSNLNAVILYPSAVVGPFDFKVSEVGQVILDFMNRKLYGYVIGGYNFVDVRDVAEALRLASKKGKNGESYIISGQTMTFKTLLQTINRVLNRKYIPPKIAIWFVKLFAKVSSAFYKLRGKKPVLSDYSISAFTRNSNFSHKKATKQLGYNPRSVIVSVEDSVNWFIENGYCKTIKRK